MRLGGRQSAAGVVGESPQVALCPLEVVEGAEGIAELAHGAARQVAAHVALLIPDEERPSGGLEREDGNSQKKK